MNNKPICSFTGPRSLDIGYYSKVEAVVKNTSQYKRIATGCARGLDEMVRDICRSSKTPCIVMNKKNYHGGKGVRALVARSMDMVQKTKESGDGCGLIAFPNDTCPKKTHPSNDWEGGGSGEWWQCPDCQRDF